MFILAVCIFALTFPVNCVAIFIKNDTNFIEAPCQYPVVHSSFFDDDHLGLKRPPELHIVNSTQNLSTNLIFPYQYILMSCSAFYPVEWIGNVPRHYLYSYILDDEVRPNNEMFTVRLHIGNETFSQDVSSNGRVACRPVYSNDSCGVTMASVNKFKDESLGNKTMLQIQFFRMDALPQDLQSIENSTAECNDWTREDDFPNLQTFQEWTTCLGDTDPTPVQPEINQTTDTKCNDALANEVASNNFLSLCVRNASIITTDIYVGDNVNVTCISAIYYFAQGMRIRLLQQTNGDSQDERDIGKFQREYAFGPGGYRNISTTFVVESNKTQKVDCSAPVRKSRRWISKTFTFTPKVPVRVSFHHTGENVMHDASGTAYLICNASGDPLPALFWSRLNNEKLPPNQTIERGGHDGGGNASSWIVSKLHFPTIPSASGPSPAEYYGRYICTAKNKFDSFEKVFLYDPAEETPIFGGNAAVWYWVTITAAILVLVVIVAWLGWKLQKQGRNLRLFSKAEMDDFLFGKPELLLDNCDDYEEMNTYAAYLPYDRNQFEIQKEQLEFDPKDIIGSGAFGTVYKGIFKGGYGRIDTVAIKTVNPSSDKMYFAALLSEIKIMCYIGKHENVVNLVGACTKYLDQRQIFVATEYCPNGDLLSYILKNRNNFIDNESQRDVQNVTKKSSEESNSSSSNNGYCKLTYAKLLLSPHLLLVWALEIAQGMTYLSSKKVIHGDLAARNVLLAGDLKPKIADFGLSKQLQKYANYVQKGDDLVPWRWLAVECLQFMKFSVQSDVWAYGVVLYELFSLGQVPYGSHTYSELFIVSLCQGERLQQPAFASDKVYSLMLDCWKHAPENRPSFASLENELKIMSVESENQMLARSSMPTPSYENISNSKLKPDSVQDVQQQQHKKKLPLKGRNENVPVNVKNGYVTEVDSVVATTQQQGQSSTRYVDLGHMDIELLPPLPPPTMQLNSSNVDWNAASG